MHLTPCLNPRIVRNRFTGEKVMIPCGKCDACQNLRSYMWSQKIVDESKSWRYMLFVTLTYNEDNCPLLFKSDSHTLQSLYRLRNHKLNDGKVHSFVIDDKLTVNIPPANKGTFEYDYYRSRRFYPYVRLADIQLFYKRLRSRIDYYDKVDNQENKKIIHFTASEMGDKTIRSHYHAIIFTNSDWIASNFRGLLAASWLFGNRDFSFARSTEKSASYVAKYCCKSLDLPSIYDDNQIRTFYTFSRSFSFGSRIISDSQILKIFHDASPVCPRYDAKKQAFVDIPLYKSLENRLFPVLRGFDKLSVHARNQLYGLWQCLSYCKFSTFKKCCQRLIFKPRSILSVSKYSLEWKYLNLNLEINKEVSDYIQRCLELDLKNHNDNNLKSLYYCSRKVVSFCKNNSVSLYYYVQQIEKYRKNKDAYRLKNQLAFEQEYSKSHPESDLVWLFPAVCDDLLHDVTVSVDAFDYVFYNERFNFVPLQQTFDWKISALENAELRKRSLKTQSVNEAFDYSRFSTTISHFEIIE